MSASDPTADATPRAVPTVAAGIYTETLARLYRRQGFLSQALVIYQQLLQKQPDHPGWQAEVTALRHQLATGAVSEPDSPVSSPASPRLHPDSTDRVIAHLQRWLDHVRRQQALAARRRE